MNYHFIRKGQNAGCPGGRPDVLFYTPSLGGGRDCRSRFVEADVNLALPYFETRQLSGSSDDIMDFVAPSWMKQILQCQELHIK